MYIQAAQFPLAYQHIVKRARQNRSVVSTFILVATDVDALCAARLLVSLLEADNVGHKVVPVSGWQEIHAIRRDLEREHVLNLVLLNLGALVDLTEDVAFPLAPGGLVHVVDSHRPVNLANLFAHTPYSLACFDARRSERDREREVSRQLSAAIERAAELAAAQRDHFEQGGDPDDAPFDPDATRNVVFWDDMEAEAEDAQRQRELQREAFDALQYEPDSDFDEDDDDDSEDEEILSQRRRRRYNSEGEEIDEDEASPGKRPRIDDDGVPLPLTRAEKRRFRGRMGRYYQSGTFSGQSVSGQVFVLAVLLERATLDSVWLAVLGLTCQFTTNLIDRDRYDSYVAALADEVARLSADHDSLSMADISDANPSRGPNDRSIRPSEELRLCLVRHWNLYDAMYHSGYIAGKLKLWKERGRKNLQGLLAKMGFSLDQCQQTFAHMDLDLKHSLYNNIETLVPEYGLFDLTYPSFVRKAGYRADMAASDVVEGLGAILEVASGVQLDFGGAFVASDAPGTREEWRPEGLRRWIEAGDYRDPRAAPGANKENERPGDEERDELDVEAQPQKKDASDEWWKRNFWLAWDAISHDDSELLRRSLPLSMALHRTIIRQGVAILNKQSIKTLRSFRLAVVEESSADVAVFSHPATLLRLALWLADAIRDLLGAGAGAGGKSSNNKALPLVLASYSKKTDAFLVVGVSPAMHYGDVKKNLLGLRFRDAAQEAEARVRHDTFDAAVVEVKRDDFKDFLSRLS